MPSGDASCSGRQWRILIAGCGSIGRRHISNLLALGQRQLHLVDPDEAALRRACEEWRLPGSSTMAQAWSWSPEAVVVANPSALHVPTAREATQHGCHLLIEKPLGSSSDGLQELVGLVRSRRLVTLVGCNMRFHPGPRLIAQTLAASTIGRPLGARLEVGSYLPSWHPGRDYRTAYSSQQAMGGGCVLDAIHELDLACWWFGMPAEVTAAIRPGVSLGIDAEEMAEILLRYEDDLLVSVHVDYVQRWRQRRYEVIGDCGTVAWDRRTARVEMMTEPDGKPQLLNEFSGYDANRMYVEELKHWLHCLDGQESLCADVAWAAKVMHVALAAKESARMRHAVALAAEPSDAAVR